MKRFGLIAAGALTLGLSALTPSFAKADGFRNDWRRDRDDNAGVQVRVDYRDDHPDGRWNGWDRWRRDRDRVVVATPAPIRALPNVDYAVSICDVPPVVMQSAQHARRGSVIESVQFVRRNGEEFYRFNLDAGFGRHLDMRIMPGGKLLGIEPC